MDKWLATLAHSDDGNRGYDRVAERSFRRFMEWLGESGVKPLRRLDADGLVEYQRKHRDEVILDEVEGFIREECSDGRYKTASHVYTCLRSFFLHNRAALPPDPSFKLHADKPPTEGTLTVDEVRRVVLSCNVMYRAVYLSMFMGGMGEKELLYWSDHGLLDLKDQLGRDLVEVTLPGRKQYRNVKPYYSYLGGDAVEALRVYMAGRRDAKGCGSIFVTKQGERLTYGALYEQWMVRLRALGLAKPKGSAGLSYRTGKNPHELRDLFRTQWTFSGARESVAEFQMGHTVDKLGYNKFMKDKEFVKEVYREAWPFLNVVSAPQTPAEASYQRKISGMRKNLEQKDTQIQKLTNTTATLAEQMAQLITRSLNDPEKMAKILAML